MTLAASAKLLPQAMIDDRLRGADMDFVLSRKLHESGPLATFIGGLATKHEVAALRAVLQETNQHVMLAGGGGSRDTGFSTAVAMPMVLEAEGSNTNSGSGGGGGESSPPASPSRGMTHLSLKQLYQRVASAEEAATRSETHCASLEARVRMAEGAIAGAASRAGQAGHECMHMWGLWVSLYHVHTPFPQAQNRSDCMHSSVRVLCLRVCL